MDLQVTTASLPHYPLGVSLALARQLGADGVELALTPAILRQGAERARQLAEARGVPVRSLSLAPLGRAAADPEQIAAVGRFAAGLPACEVVVLPAPRADEAGGLGAYFGTIGHYLDALAGGQAILAIENAAPHPEGLRPGGPAGTAGPLDRFAPLRRLVEEWDLAFTYDTSHAAAHGWVLAEPLPLMGARLRNVQLSDFRPSARGGAELLPSRVSDRQLHQPPGEGILPLRAFLRTLCRRGYGGLLTLELSPRSLRAWWPPSARHRLAAALEFCRATARDCGAPDPAATLGPQSEREATARADAERRGDGGDAARGDGRGAK